MPVSKKRRKSPYKPTQTPLLDAVDKQRAKPQPLPPLLDLVDNQRYSPEQAGQFLGVSPDTLAIWRCLKRYPLSYYKIGRFVQYLGRDLREFAESRRVEVRAI